MTAARTRFGSAVQTKGLGLSVCLGDEAVDGDLEINDGSEDAALEASARELGEEAFDRIEPGRRGRGEVERPARMLRQPLAHLGMLVGGIVVDDGVDHFSHRNLRLDRVEEADELLVAMALHVAADDGAVEDVEGGEQRGGAVTFVVVRHRPGAAWLHRQSRLGAVERLDLALLVDREDDRMGGRIDVEADDVLELLGELRVVRQLERSDAMRRELVGLKDALHRPQADARRLRQHPAGPVGCFSRRRSERQVDDPLHGVGRQRLLAGLARLVARQPLDAFCHEPRLPGPHHRLRFARSAHDLGGAAAVGRGENDVGAPHVLLRRAAVRDDRLKPMAVRARDVDDNSCSHAESLNCFGRFGNRLNESDH